MVGGLGVRISQWGERGLEVGVWGRGPEVKGFKGGKSQG